MREIIERTANGAILYDKAIVNQMTDASFDPSRWAIAQPIGGGLRSGGRGNTMVVGDSQREFVLRHYMRGGLPGRIVRDTYIWCGEDRVRAFAEWQLLAKLKAKSLPVPTPVGARYRRYGTFYKADLLTLKIDGVRTLADRIAAAPGDRDFWQRIGGTLQRFHAAGVCHADLNAYNIQIDAEDGVYLLDFDRGRLLAPGVWQQKNLARLHRSLRKIRALDNRIQFNPSAWNELLEGYFSASRSA